MSSGSLMRSWKIFVMTVNDSFKLTRMSCDGEKLQRSLLSGQWREQAGIASQCVLVQLGKQVVDGDFKAYLRSPLAGEVLALRSDTVHDFSLPIKGWFD